MIHLIFRGDWQNVVQRIRTNPEEAKVKCTRENLPLHWHTWGNLPLHNACLYNAPHEVIEELLGVHPEAAHVQNDIGDFPLHFICDMSRESTRLQTFQLLLNANPAATSTANSHGELPLHRAARSTSTRADALGLLIASYSDAAHIADNRGYLPIHRLCEYNNDAFDQNKRDSFGMLLNANPNAVFVADNLGRMPLHIACLWWGEGCMEMFQVLLNANPNAVRAIDNEGHDAFYYAYFNRKVGLQMVNAMFNLSSCGKLLASINQLKQKLDQSHATNQELTVAFAGAMKNLQMVEKDANGP